MQQGEIYPGLSTFEETGILDLLQPHYMINSPVCLVTARIQRGNADVDVYFKGHVDLEWLDSFQTDAFSFVFAYSSPKVRLHSSPPSKFMALTQLVESGLYPIFLAGNTIDLDYSSLSRRMPWLYRKPGDWPLLADDIDVVGNLNIAHIIMRYALLGIDLDDFNDIVVSIDKNERTVDVEYSVVINQSAKAASSVRVLDGRLSTRPESHSAWRWNSQLRETVEPKRYLEHNDSRRLVLSRW